jgi:hypothetical protein
MRVAGVLGGERQIDEGASTCCCIHQSTLRSPASATQSSRFGPNVTESQRLLWRAGMKIEAGR